MYLSHFQLEKEPFNISPDPAFLWLSEKHAKAFVTLKEGILKPDGCVLLTGDIGTGKTTLIKRLPAHCWGTGSFTPGGSSAGNGEPPFLPLGGDFGGRTPLGRSSPSNSIMSETLL